VLGGGKTTQVKILAGDLEPTAGEVIKSSKDLRVAFLRQEFVDELVMERSLKEELISVFTEEAAVLAALQECEVRGPFCTQDACLFLGICLNFKCIEEILLWKETLSCLLHHSRLHSLPSYK